MELVPWNGHETARDQNRKTTTNQNLKWRSSVQLIHLQNNSWIQGSGNVERGGAKVVRARGLGSLLWDRVSQIWQKLHPQSLTNDCLNTSWTWTTIDMLTRIVGKAHEASNLPRELQAAKKCWEQEKSPSLGKRILTGYPAPNGQPWKHVCMWHYTQTEQVIIRNIDVYAYACNNSK